MTGIPYKALIEAWERCKCGKLIPWTDNDPIFVHCDRCGELVVMSTKDFMAEQGRLDGSLPPYKVELSGPELDAITDGLEELLKFITEKQAKTPAFNEEAVQEHAGAYVFVRLTKQRLEDMKDAI